MIKYLFGISVFLSGGFSYAQVTTTIQWHTPGASSTGDTIYYNPDNKLNWDDFKGIPDGGSIATAITESGFGYRIVIYSVARITCAGSMPLNSSCYLCI